MFSIQAVGKLVKNNKIMGYKLFHYRTKRLVGVAVEDCLKEVLAGVISNLAVENGSIVVTDGNIDKLPSYIVRADGFGFQPCPNSLPVIVERVVMYGKTVGYTIIENGEYKKYKTAELIQKYQKFYNAKVVRKGNTVYISAIKHNFRVLDLCERVKDRGNSSKYTYKKDGYEKIVDGVKYIYRPDDFKVEYINGNGTTVTYCGNDQNIILPQGIEFLHRFRSKPFVRRIIIPSTVREIGSSAFYCDEFKEFTEVYMGNTSLESVIMEKGVKRIEANAFQGNVKLVSVSLPDSLVYIGRYAFLDCCNLRNIIIPDSVMNIYEGAFRGCKGLQEINIPDSVENVYRFAFSKCTNLKKVTIGSKFQSDFYDAFSDCRNIESITISEDNPNYKVKDGRVVRKKEHSYIRFYDNVCRVEDFVIDNKVLVKYRGFDRGVTIPNGVEKIGDKAFCKRVGLEEVVIPNGVKVIDKDAFWWCQSLKFVIVPDSVTTIGDYAFNGCSLLVSIELSDNVVSIGKNAFEYCDNIVVRCHKGSYAEQYCKDNNIRYEII